MKYLTRQQRRRNLIFVTLAYLQGLFLPFAAKAQIIPLTEESFTHVIFEDIPPTHYEFKGGVLQAEVKKSASFLLHAFKEIKTVQTVRFQWKARGEFKIAAAEQEKSKEGDDTRFRIGLILHGEKPFIPFFAPAWVKLIAEHLKFPSDRMLYLVAGALHAAHEKWQNPFADSIEHLALKSTEGKGGWQEAYQRFAKPKKVVGLFLGADGDNSASTFSSALKDLDLE